MLAADSVGLGDRRGCNEPKELLEVNNGFLYRRISLKLEGWRRAVVAGRQLRVISLHVRTFEVAS
jgi:hypothetical protein